MLLLETIINQYLSLDPETRDKLEPFAGRVICMQLTGTGVSLYFFPSAEGIHVRTKYNGEVHATITGTPLSLFKMSMVSDAANMLLKGELEITGDTRLGHRFKKVFSEMDIDWSRPLARIVGDNLAYPLQQSVRSFVNWGSDAMKNVSMSLGEYLQEESRDVVSETELAMFYRDVDKLRDDASRLQAKLSAFQRTHNNNS
jgi:ubiquinone biosynthesis protein UbiJ